MLVSSYQVCSQMDVLGSHSGSNAANWNLARHTLFVARLVARENTLVRL